MTANVADNALLLEVIAGPDGLDSRQHQVPRVDKYTEALRQGVKGLRIGVLKEGFGHRQCRARRRCQGARRGGALQDRSARSSKRCRCRSI